MENENTTEATFVAQEPTVEVVPMFGRPTITAETPKDRVALLKKVFDLHKAMRSIKWEPDGHNKSWNHDYFTAGLIKSNFQKSCIDVGLIYYLDILDVEDLAPTKGFNVRQRMDGYLGLIDIDTGAEFVYPTIGEAGDSGDKCSAKLVTMTIKSAIATNFAIADIDPEFDIADNFGREAKQEQAVNVLREKATPTVNKPVTEQKAETQVEVPKKAPSPATAKETAKEPVKDAPRLEKNNENAEKDMTSVQKNTISMIYGIIADDKPEGFDLSLFEESYKDVLENGNRGTADAWIRKHRGMMR